MPLDRLPDKPHALPLEKVVAQLDVDPEQGLSMSEVGLRRRRFGANLLRQQPPASLLQIAWNQMRSPVVALLAAAAVLAGTFSHWADSIAILAVLAINSAIGFVTELRAMRSMEALRQLAARSVRVRRDGQPDTIPADDLVPGDIVILDAGDVITADMRVISSANLACDESALTGESLPVAKSPDPTVVATVLAERTSMAFKGCAVTRGTGEGLVTATGMQTELGRITHLVEESEPERSPLERQLERLSRDLIWVTLAVAFAVGLAGIYVGKDIPLMIETAVALAVAAIPEGLPIVATLALARGMLRMARHNALLDRLSAVETLGATTVILTDKTGTLTENRMHVDRVVTGDGEAVLDRRAGRFTREGHAAAVEPDAPLARLLQVSALCNNAALGDDGNVGDPMEVALLEAARTSGIARSELLQSLSEVAEHAFDAGTRMMATVHRDGGRFLFAVKGAPEAVFDKLRSVEHPGGKTAAFDDREASHWMSVCDALAGQGLRLLAVAGKHGDSAEEDPYAGLCLYGVVAFQDPPRSDVAAALADAGRAGIRVVMVTGDHARTARSISQAVGLAVVTELDVVDGSDLKPLADMTGAERDIVRKAVVFSRVSPQQKLDLIALHQQAGEIVAMTGDGVNDAPALKKAEIGIAMGKRGTPVAREAADMVLRDDAFSTIVHAIREGRIIYTNIRRFTTYLLSCNLSEILVIGLAILGGLPLPLLPLQILFLNLVTDVFPAFALGTIAGDRDVLNRPPRPPAETILTRAQWLAILTHGAIIALATLAAAAIAVFHLGLTGDEVTTMCFYTLALAQLWHVFNMRNWRDGPIVNQLTRNLYVWLAVAICLAILAAAAVQPQLATVLHIVPLGGDAWGILVALSIVPLVAREIAAIVRRRTRLSSTSEPARSCDR